MWYINYCGFVVLTFTDLASELGLSKARLAVAFGVSPNTIRAYDKSCPDAVLECMAGWVLYKRRLEALGFVVKRPARRGVKGGFNRGKPS